MPKKIDNTSLIKVDGNKIIEEYVGLMNSGSREISIAHIKSLKGWSEPEQRPEFKEYALVIDREMLAETESEEILSIKKGKFFIVNSIEWVKYNTPYIDTEYIAVFLPAFSYAKAFRDNVV